MRTYFTTLLPLALCQFLLLSSCGTFNEAEARAIHARVLTLDTHKDIDESGYHTDTLEFKNGAWVRMQDLDNAYAYMRATVQALPGEHSDRQNTREPATINA
ncbi:MAG: hypothetical protein IIB42_06770 [Candidatus Marinimicrobia bacterium]|nr:hypothetical protein [Candidatus Neomarinimicrobiota bacterium]